MVFILAIAFLIIFHKFVRYSMNNFDYFKNDKNYVSAGRKRLTIKLLLISELIFIVTILPYLWFNF